MFLVFIVSSRVRQFLSRAKTKTMHKEANKQKAKARNGKQKAHCK